METFAKIQKGEIVLIDFPFSDLSGSKIRPAIVVANPIGDDILICQITGKQVNDEYSVDLADDDFEKGNLDLRSNIRTNKLFTADKSIVKYRLGFIKKYKLQEVKNKINQIIAS